MKPVKRRLMEHHIAYLLDDSAKTLPEDLYKVRRDACF